MQRVFIFFAAMGTLKGFHPHRMPRTILIGKARDGFAVDFNKT